MSLRPARNIPPGDGYRLLTKRSLPMPTLTGPSVGMSRSHIFIDLVAKTLGRIEDSPLPSDAAGEDLVYDCWPRYPISAEVVEITVWYRSRTFKT
jgi:hypothetical protein